VRGEVRRGNVRRDVVRRGDVRRHVVRRDVVWDDVVQLVAVRRGCNVNYHVSYRVNTFLTFLILKSPNNYPSR